MKGPAVPSDSVWDAIKLIAVKEIINGRRKNSQSVKACQKRAAAPHIQQVYCDSSTARTSGGDSGNGVSAVQRKTADAVECAVDFHVCDDSLYVQL